MPPRLGVSLACLGLLVTLLAGCTGQTPTENPDNILAQAEAEATAIVQAAQATALILKAQAQATSMVAGTGALSPAVEPTQTQQPASIAVTDAGSDNLQMSPTLAASITSLPYDEVQLVGVGYAGEGAYIVVHFTAPPRLARSWQITMVYVVDEASETVYADVPVMPILGALFSKPKEAGQMGYVMFENDPPLSPGSLVTVVLGEFKQEHVVIGQESGL